MKDRIFKNWRSSLLGLLILIAALVFVYLKKATFTEAMSVGVPLAIGLMFVKDPSKFTQI